MNEIWKTIKDYPNYKISNIGNIISLNTGKEKIASDNGKGYLTVTLYNHSKGKHFYIHRLVAEHFLNNPKNLLEVNHIDGNKQNNYYLNLEWVTRAENMKHAWDNKLIKSTLKQKMVANNNLSSATKEQLKLGREKLIKTNSLKSKNEYIWAQRKNVISLYCVELNKVFLSASRVEYKLGIKQNTLLCSIKRGHKTCGGYHWKILTKKY